MPWNSRGKNMQIASQPFMFPSAFFLSNEPSGCRTLFQIVCTLSHFVAYCLHIVTVHENKRFTSASLPRPQDEKPPSQIAFFRTLYPEITPTLRAGHTLKQLHQRLVADGVEVAYSLLRTYVSHIRREKAPSLSALQSRQSPPATATAARTSTVTENPLANAMRVLSKPRYSVREAMCDGDPSKKSWFDCQIPGSPIPLYIEALVW